MKRKPPKPRQCGVCRAEFVPKRLGQKTCERFACAIEWGKRQQAKKNEREKKRARMWRRAELDRLKTVSELTKECQRSFNAWIVLRDAGLPCASCGTTDSQKGIHNGWVASHYRSVGACPELRFEPLNVNKACTRCNSHLSGNIIEYRIRLLARIGAEKLAWLEGPHEPKRYRGDELREIKARFLLLTRELRKSGAPVGKFGRGEPPVVAERNAPNGS